jgi:hypothetical protein
MAKYCKKSVIFEAFKWTADSHQTEEPIWIVEALSKKWGEECSARILDEGTSSVHMEIFTLEGIHTARRGDYIIRGIKGEIYPCKPDIFEQMYELVSQSMKNNGGKIGLFSWLFRRRKPISFKIKAYRDLKFNIVIYDDVRYLRKVYTVHTGQKASTVKGFYNPATKTIHAIEDSLVIGHEIRHLIGEKHAIGEIFDDEN